MSEDNNLSLKDYPPQENRPGYVVLRTSEPDHYVVLRDCPLCGKPSRVKVPSQGLWDWEHGAFVQKAFPDLTAGQREQVMNGAHEDCFNAAFPPEDIEDAEENR